MTKVFKAMRVTEDASGKFTRKIESRPLSDLTSGDVLVKIAFTALNYKDGLSAIGNKGVTKQYPHTPGIDGAGIVEESNNSNFQSGDQVIVTSYDLGMNTDGAFAEYIRVPAEWIVPLPSGLSLRESMIIGTAGLTAAIGLYKMQKMGQHPDQGPIVVSGASGGVGSMAVALFSRAGYEVIASSGKEDASAYLRDLGASQVVDRDFVNDDSSRPMMKPKWAGALDTVGGNTLSTLLKGCMPNGNVASCGLVGTPFFSSTVFPFILNGINLIGLDSANFPMEQRKEIWNKLAGDWRMSGLDNIAVECTLEELDLYINKILKGELKGRVIIAM